MRSSPLENFGMPVVIFLLVMSLMTIGLVGVYSASASLSGHERRAQAAHAGKPMDDTTYHDPGYLNKQIRFAAMGLALMAFFYKFDYRRLKRGSFWIMALSFVACILVWAPKIGVASNGAHRWLNMGVGQIQPSEFAKLALIIYMAKMLDDRRRFIKSFFSGVLPAMIVTGVFALVIVVEPDFGATFVLCCVIFGMWICGEMSWLHLCGLVFAAVPAGVAAFIMQPYRVGRLLAFVSDDPEVLKGKGYQLYQSLIAVGSGGWTGLGLGESMQKYHYLFAGHTDFIFAILCEELGFVGGSVIVLLYVALVLAGWIVALNTPDLFGSLLATGVTLHVFLGAAINMCVVTGLLPTKGLVLPFISCGGSSLIVALGSMGILMNIAKLQRELSSAPSPLPAPVPRLA